MRIILVGFGVVGKAVTTILARRYAEKVRDYRFNPRIVAIADLDGAVINPRGLSSEKLEAIKKRGYPISSDPDFGHPGISALKVIESVEAEVVVEVTPVNIKDAEPALSFVSCHNMFSSFKRLSNMGQSRFCVFNIYRRNFNNHFSFN